MHEIAEKTIFEIIIAKEKNLHKNPSEGNIIMMTTMTRSAAITLTLTLIRAHSLHSQRSLSQSKSLAKIWSKIHSFQHAIGERERESYCSRGDGEYIGFRVS
jgi:hypothetical protein